MLTMDYRCHITAKNVRRQLPPEANGCVAKLAAQGVEGLQKKYRMSRSVAQPYHRRAVLLQSRG